MGIKKSERAAAKARVAGKPKKLTRGEARRLKAGKPVKGGGFILSKELVDDDMENQQLKSGLSEVAATDREKERVAAFARAEGLLGRLETLVKQLNQPSNEHQFLAATNEGMVRAAQPIFANGQPTGLRQAPTPVSHYEAWHKQLDACWERVTRSYSDIQTLRLALKEADPTLGDTMSQANKLVDLTRIYLQELEYLQHITELGRSNG